MIAESEHARSDVFDNPESVYRACADMKLFTQEVLRVVLLDAKQRLISIVDITKGTLNEALAHPREIFRPVITHWAFSFILAHNLWAATHELHFSPPSWRSPSMCCHSLSRRDAGPKMLCIMWTE
jgi:RadC-like JAB domain